MQTDSTREFRDDDEPIGESLFSPLGWLGAFAVLALVGAAQIADQQDHRAEWAESQALKAAQAQQEQIARSVSAAQAMCASDFGPQVLAVWVDPGTVECVGPRGQRLVSFSPEVAHASR